MGKIYFLSYFAIFNIFPPTKKMAARLSSHQVHYEKSVISLSFRVSAKYSCGFPNTLFPSIIAGEGYLDYFTTITEDRLWQLLAKLVFR